MDNQLHFSVISTLTDVLPVLTGAWFYRNITRATEPFYYFFYFVVLQDYFSTLVSLHHHYNLWLMNAYQLVEACFYIVVFHRFLFRRAHDRWLWFVLIATVLFWVITNFFVYAINEPNSILRTVECLAVILYSGSVLIRLSKEFSIPLFSNPFFWLASGCLTYFSITLIVYSLLPMIVGNDYFNPIFEPVWMVHSVMNIFSNLLFAIAFLCPSRTSRFPQIKSFSLSPSH